MLSILYLFGEKLSTLFRRFTLFCEKIPRQKTAKEQALSNTCPFHFLALTRFTRTEKLYAVPTDSKPVFRRYA